MKDIFSDLLIRIASQYAKFSPNARLSDAIRSTERALSYGRDETDAVARIADRKIVCMDVGARGGMLDYLRAYAPFLEMLLVEPDPREAARLRACGLNVIEALILGQAGQNIINVTVNPGNASVLEPTGPIMHYYAQGDLARFRVLERVSLPAVTVDDAMAANGETLDYIKMDTQGSELAILEGAKRAKPIFIVTEASTAELYDKQCLFYDIGKLLYSRGYILFDLSLRSVRPRPQYRKKGERPSLGLPLHGDAYFMPDWTRPEGRALFAGRERIWASLMLMHGLRDVLRYIFDVEKIADGDFLQAELSK